MRFRFSPFSGSSRNCSPSLLLKYFVHRCRLGEQITFALSFCCSFTFFLCVVVLFSWQSMRSCCCPFFCSSPQSYSNAVIEMFWMPLSLVAWVSLLHSSNFLENHFLFANMSTCSCFFLRFFVVLLKQLGWTIRKSPTCLPPCLDILVLPNRSCHPKGMKCFMLNFLTWSWV